MSITQTIRDHFEAKKKEGLVLEKVTLLCPTIETIDAIISNGGHICTRTPPYTTHIEPILCSKVQVMVPSQWIEEGSSSFDDTIWNLYPEDFIKFLIPSDPPVLVVAREDEELISWAMIVTLQKEVLMLLEDHPLEVS